MLRIEYKGQPYDWFNLDEMGDIVRTSDFSNTLKENIAHYFGVPLEFQAVYDEEGLLSSVVDFARALRSMRPWLRVYDVRDMVAELKEKTAQQLEEVYAEVMRSRRNFCTPSSGSSAKGSSPPRLANSMADVVRSVNESGLGIGSSYSSKQAFESPPRNFQWSNTGMEANMLPNPVANSTSSRYATPPPLRTAAIPGVVPSSTGIPGVVPAQNGVSSWAQSSHLGLPASPSQVWRAPSYPQMQPPSVGSAIPPYSSTPPRSMPTLPSMSSLGSNAIAGTVPVTAAPTMASPRQPSPKQERSPRMSSREDESAVDVYLVKEPPFERFGFANVPSRDGRALLVSWVDPSGLLEVKWNREHQDKRILEGDRIIAVNNNGNLEDMRQQLQSKSVQLRVQRQTSER